MIGIGERVLPRSSENVYNFLTIFSHLSEHHKFEYFSQPWWDIQVCEKIKFMER